ACNTSCIGTVYSIRVPCVTGVQTCARPFFAGPLVAGTYHWLAVFSGDTNNPGPVDSGCASEPVVITASPSITTTQSETTGGLGEIGRASCREKGTSNVVGGGMGT